MDVNPFLELDPAAAAAMTPAAPASEPPPRAPAPKAKAVEPPPGFDLADDKTYAPPIRTATAPSIAERMSEGWSQGFGAGPVGLTPGDLAKHPGMDNPLVRGAAKAVDYAQRLPGGIIGELAGGGAGLAQGAGMSPAWATRLQGDLNVLPFAIPDAAAPHITGLPEEPAPATPAPAAPGPHAEQFAREMADLARQREAAEAAARPQLPAPGAPAAPASQPAPAQPSPPAPVAPGGVGPAPADLAPAIPQAPEQTGQVASAPSASKPSPQITPESPENPAFGAQNTPESPIPADGGMGTPASAFGVTASEPLPAPTGDGTRANPIKVTAPEHMEAARSQVAEPTDAQKEAENYKVGHVVFDGLPISVETPKGAVRSGTDEDGKPWESPPLPADYGRIKGSLGADGDHVDVHIGDAGPTGQAYVVDQHDPKTGEFDEHKVIVGAHDLHDAMRIYTGGFSDGSGLRRIGGITQVPTSYIKDWIAQGEQRGAFAPHDRGETPPEGFEPAEKPNSSTPTPISTGDSGPGQSKPSQEPAPVDLKGNTPRPRATEPQSLVQFLRSLGGVQDLGGDLRSQDLHRRFIGLVSKRGMSLDRAREAAAEAGYLGADTERAVAETTPNDLLDAIGRHPTFSVHDDDRVFQAQERARLRDHSDKIRDELVQAGIPDHGIDRGLLRKAAEAVRDGVPLHDAWEHAIMAEHMADEGRAEATRAALPDIPWDDFTDYTEGKFDDGHASEAPEAHAGAAPESGGGDARSGEEGAGPGEEGEPRPISAQSDEPRAPESLSSDEVHPDSPFAKILGRLDQGAPWHQKAALAWDKASLNQRGPIVQSLGIKNRRFSGYTAEEQQAIWDKMRGAPESKEPTPDPYGAFNRALDEILSRGYKIRVRKSTSGNDKGKFSGSVVGGPHDGTNGLADRTPEGARREVARSIYEREQAGIGSPKPSTPADTRRAELEQTEKGKVPVIDDRERQRLENVRKLDAIEAEKAAQPEATKPVTPAEVAPELKPSGASVIQYPTGKFGYVGKVPDEIAFVEGATPEKIRDAKMFGERFGPKKPIFDSAQEAVDYAKERGFSVHVAGDAKPREPSPNDRELSSNVPRSLPDAVAEHLLAGNSFPNILAARRFVAENGGKDLNAKAMEETVEHGIVKAAREIIGKGDSPESTYGQLVDLYGRQPNLSTRTSTSVEQQAYSTPAPLAYLASRAAGITKKSVVYEPTAGNGMLLIGANPKNVVANELNPSRAAALEEQGFRTTQRDASDESALPAGKADAVIANPPFGVVKENGQSKNFDVGHTQPGYRTNEIDHAIALNALRAMKDDGRATLILGGINKLVKTDEGRADAYNGKAKREFFHVLYNNYNVVDHYTVAGELYAKQGAGYPVDVIVIDGRGKSALKVPSIASPKVYSSWDELKEKLNESARPEANEGRDREPAGEPLGIREPGPATRGDAGDHADAGGREPRPSGRADGQPNGVRPGRDRGEPGAERPDLGSGGEAVRPDVVRDAGGSGELAPAGRQPRAVKQEAETEGQVAYKPRSQSTDGLGTLVPKNMRASTDEALAKLAKTYGSTDQLVADKLGMPTEDLHKYFAAEQVDALALALHNLSKGAGFIIGDQTGIGKGRVNAAIIRYAIKNGMTPIFVTEKANLYGDMYRDMQDIGMPDYLGREPRILMTNANETVPLDEEGKVVLKTRDAKAHNALLTSLGNEGGIGDHDVVFTTYNQLQTVKGEATPRQRFLDTIAHNAVLILDESHNAGGTEAGDSMIKPKKDAPPNRAKFVRDLVGKSKGTFYSSATYAKRPDVMDLYAKTDMSKAVAKIEDLAAAIKKGGIPMQQAVAAQLAQAGQYIRRERSFAGVSYDATSVSVDRGAYDDFSRAIAAVNEFSKHMKGAVKDIAKDIRDAAAAVSPDGSTGGAGASSTNFTSIMHNLVNQLLLAAKAKPAVDRALAALERGEKPVLTVANTMESFLDAFAEANDIKPGDAVDMSFRDLLQRYLDRTRTITIKKPFSKEKGEKKYLSDAELGPLGVAAYKAAQKIIRETRLGDLPISPIDYMKDKIEAAGYKVGEITGRGTGISYKGDTPRFYVRPQADSSIKGRRKAIADFNNGSTHAMILNRAGSTGLSLHASEKFKDQSPRKMLLVQPEENIDTHMQMLGRVHRTGQVVLPGYEQLVADIPAEKRPAAVLAKKMASLNASTTASRKGALTAENVPDFMNEYGDTVAYLTLRENPMLNVRLGEPITFGDTTPESLDGAMRKVTGRIPLLPIKEQEDLYRVLESNYADFLAEKEQAGENALEAKRLDLDAKTISSTVVRAGTGDSPFQAPVHAETIDAKKQSRPYKASDLVDDAWKSLNGDNPRPEKFGAGAEAIENLQATGEAHAAADASNALDKFKAYRKDLLGDIEKDETRANAVQRLDDNEERFKYVMSKAHVGAPVTVRTPEMNFTGIVTRVHRSGDAQNPLALGSWKVTMAVPGQGPIQFSFMKLFPQVNENGFAIESAHREDLGEMMKRFDEMAKNSREKRIVLTGNMLAAYDFAGRRGQITNFTDHEGNVRQGVLMPASVEKLSDITAGKGTPIKEPQEVLARLADAGGTLESTDKKVTLSAQRNGTLVISVPSSKLEGAQFFLNPELRRAVGGDFTKRGGFMRGEISAYYGGEPAKLKAIQALMDAGASFEKPYEAPKPE